MTRKGANDPTSTRAERRLKAAQRRVQGTPKRQEKTARDLEYDRILARNPEGNNRVKGHGAPEYRQSRRHHRGSRVDSDHNR